MLENSPVEIRENRDKSATPVIRVNGVTKEFRRAKQFPGRFGAIRSIFTRQYVVTRAVKGISFSIQEGELVGYLGPNGAGKSTTIKMLTGVLVPTEGHVEVSGVVPWQDRERNALQIGVVFGQRSQLWWDLPLIESLRLMCILYRVPDDVAAKNLAKFTELLELADFLDTPVRQLSLGQRMRGDLAAAMIYEPRILYLDEPTVGLDVTAKDRVLGFLEEINRVGSTTILLTTHDLADVERLCKRIILIDKGRVLYDGSVEKLKSDIAPRRTMIVKPEAVDQVEDGVILEDVTVRVQPDGSIQYEFDPSTIPASTLVAYVSSRLPIRDVSIVEPDLATVVRRLYAN